MYPHPEKSNQMKQRYVPIAKMHMLLLTKVSKTQTAASLICVVRGAPISSFSILLRSLSKSFFEQMKGSSCFASLREGFFSVEGKSRSYSETRPTSTVNLFSKLLRSKKICTGNESSVDFSNNFPMSLKAKLFNAWQFEAHIPAMLGDALQMTSRGVRSRSSRPFTSMFRSIAL
jgi:hypothetical protein